MSMNTAKLVDPSAIGEGGRGVSATLARSEFEEALKAGRGPVSLSLDVNRVSGGQPEVEAHTLDIELERRALKKLLKNADGDAITLTFDENELLELLGDDVEAHGIRETALVLTVAAATAAAGTGAYVASTLGHHTSTPAVVQAGYMTSAAAEALGTSVQPVSDAATGGYLAPAIATSDSVAPIDAGSAIANPAIVAEQASDAATGGYQMPVVDSASAVAPIDAGSDVPNPAITPEQVSDAATGGYQTGDTAYSAGAPGGYLSSETAQVIGGQQVTSATGGTTEAPTTASEEVSGAYTGGSTSYSADMPGGYAGSETAQAIGGAPTQGSDAGTAEGGYLTTASAEALSASSQPVSDAATGGYAQAPEQVSDAATGGYATQAEGGYLTTASAEALGASAQPVSDAATGGYAQTPEQISDAATGGYEAPTPRSGPVSSEAGSYDPSVPGGYTGSVTDQVVGATDQSDAVSRYMANTQSDDSDAVSRYVANAQTDESDAVSRYVANQTPEQVSDAATGGYATQAEGGYLTTASAEALQRRGERRGLPHRQGPVAEHGHHAA